MRVLIKFGYLPDFDAFAMVDNGTSVEGAMLSAISRVTGLGSTPREARKKLKWEAASRTDRGVGAVENAAAFDLPDIERIKGIATILSREGIFVHHFTEVEDDFSPRRRALWREYRFFLPTDARVSELKRIATLFLGKHDFSAFSKRDHTRPNMSTFCTVQDIDVIDIDGHVVLVIRADRFLWNMVRIIASAILKCHNGDLTEDDILTALDGDKKISVGKLPSDGLYLWHVRYDNQIESKMKKIPVEIQVWKFLGLYSMAKEIKRRTTPSLPSGR